MKIALSVQNSSVPCVQVRWPGTFLERAPPYYYEAGSGLALRGSLGYNQIFLKA